MDNGARDFKIVFIGTSGAGKSTAIRTLSDHPPVSTEVPASDENRMTTVALDFGEIKLEDDFIVRLYGMPGQDRFGFLWPMVSAGALGALLFLDARQPAPTRVLDDYVDNFRTILRTCPCLLVVSHVDEASHPCDIRQLSRHLRERGHDMPVLEIDPRQPADVRYALQLLLETLLPAQEDAHAP